MSTLTGSGQTTILAAPPNLRYTMQPPGLGQSGSMAIGNSYCVPVWITYWSGGIRVGFNGVNAASEGGGLNLYIGCFNTSFSYDGSVVLASVINGLSVTNGAGMWGFGTGANPADGQVTYFAPAPTRSGPIRTASFPPTRLPMRASRRRPTTARLPPVAAR